MVVDIINKTLDTTAIVKNTDTDITYRTILYPYFDGHFYENWELALFLEKSRSIRNTNLLPLELNKSLKTVQFNNQLLAKENKTLLAFNEVQALGGTTYTLYLLLGFILFMNRKIINQIYF
jgi:hypothetical protein